MTPEELSRRTADMDLEVHRVDCRPIVRTYMQRLGLVELVNQALVTEMEVEPGLVVAGMIQDTFSGRSPLYRLESFFAHEDAELLLGVNPPPGTFADHNVGRVMDRIYEAGASQVFLKLALAAIETFEIDVSTGHWDSTSVSVWGDYDVYGHQPGNVGDDEDRIRLVHGKSKDNRPDLKQFLVSMLCVEGNIPILGDHHDGNASDKTLNNQLLSRIRSHLRRHQLADSTFTYVADCAVVTESNLEWFRPVQAGEGPTLYLVTRLPFTYNEADRVVAEAVAADQWEDVGVLAKAEPTAKRPVAHYKVREADVELYGNSYRAVVVHSSALDKRRLKRIDRELRKDREDLTAKVAEAARRPFHCRADADAALAALRRTRAAYHGVEGRVEEELKFAPGRPCKDGTRRIRKRLFRVRAEVVERPEEAARKRAEAGCFVLLSNHPREGPAAKSARDVLRAYKDQDGVETNYRFLKDPLIVNDLFLKKPERIEALGMVLLACLLIWNLIQRDMRRHLEATGTTLPGWKNRDTDRPTTFMLTTKFAGLLVLKAGDARVLHTALNDVQRQYLHALNLPAWIFVDPRPPP